MHHCMKLLLLGFLAFDLCSNFGSFVESLVGNAFAFAQVGIDLGLVLVEEWQNNPVIDHRGSIQWAHQPDQKNTLK